MTLIDKYNREIRTLCSQHKVKKLYVFGSVLNADFNTASDVDFIVDFEPIDLKYYADNYFNLKFALEDALHRPVDLLEEKAIKNPYFKKSVENSRQLIYGAWNKTWLYDILTAINEIESFLADVPDFESYENDLKTKRAIERNLEIIGEAMNRIYKRDPSFQLSNSRKIIDTRNRIIHGYDNVSNEVVWSIVHKHLQELKQEITEMLRL